MYDLLGEEGSVMLAVSPLLFGKSGVTRPVNHLSGLSVTWLSAVSNAADMWSQGAQMSP